MSEHRNRNRRRRFTSFDFVVFAGGAVNLVVITWLLGYWLLHG